MHKVLLGLILSMTALFLDANEPQKLVFAPLPTQNEESIFKTFSPMVHYLEKSLNVTISFHFSPSYEALLADIQQGKVDIAYLGPLPYIELKTTSSFVEPLVFFNEANGKPMYRCVLVAWGDSYLPLSKLNSFHSFALTDPLSTCGYLSVSVLLREAGKSLDQQPFAYLGKHDEVALSVIKGRFDYGGVKSDVARAYAHLGLDVVAQTAPIPSFALVSNSQKLSQSFQKHITEVLLTAPASEYKTWGKGINKGVSLAHDDAYEPIRAMRRESTLVKQGTAQ